MDSLNGHLADLPLSHQSIWDTLNTNGFVEEEKKLWKKANK